MKPDEQLRSDIKTVTGSEALRESDKLMLVLSYLGILALIPLLTVKDSEFVTWHAKQGLVLGVGGTIACAVLLMIVPFFFLSCLLWPALLVVNILGMVKALNGIRWRIPGVTQLAEKL